MDFQKLREKINEEIQLHKLQQIENFDRIRKCLSNFKEKRDRMYKLCEILDACYTSDPKKRVTVCELIENCDEKYGVNATYKDLSLDDQELVLKYIF